MDAWHYGNSIDYVAERDGEPIQMTFMDVVEFASGHSFVEEQTMGLHTSMQEALYNLIVQALQQLVKLKDLIFQYVNRS